MFHKIILEQAGLHKLFDLLKIGPGKDQALSLHGIYLSNFVDHADVTGLTLLLATMFSAVILATGETSGRAGDSHGRSSTSYENAICPGASRCSLDFS